ncbi:hypothetical protein AAG747_12880 [Rapidithrix thailandica]|uniref:Uncharacterized protein n=1 Tax=Rapidithrix thailandica TaxID=413964 RepID=A0AAW9SBW4_9BACT
MEEQNQQKKSIWGNWWEPLRKWVYPAWLMYETSIRFYHYAQGVHTYFEKHQEGLASYIGEIGTLTLDLICSVATFAGCTVFLTMPACFLLYKFFKEDNFINTRFEEKIKILF